MAQKSTPVVLNVGSQRVALANIVGGSKGTLALTKYHTREMAGDASADASRIPQVRLAVQELVNESKSKGSLVRYAVPGHPVFTRFVKLPPVSEDKVEQIVRFEAEQNVPHPLNEVVWGYQLIGEPGGSDVEVLLGAIKADELSQFNAAVTASGVQTLSVDVAPMLVYNAYRYNYPDQTKPALIIDIGAKTTDLIYAEADKVFINSARIGGASITQAISKDLEISFEEAEQLKISKGYCSLGGSYQEPSEDPQAIQMGAIIRNTVTRLQGEIARSNTRYKTQQGGNLPQIAYLAGRSAGIPYLLEFLQEKLGIPVEYFNALRNVSVGPKVSQDVLGADAHSLGELVGLALRNGEASPIELELIPPSVSQARDIEKRKPALILAATGLLASLAAGAFYFHRGAEVANARVDAQKIQVAELESVQKGLEASRRTLADVKEETQPYVGAMTGRAYWIDFLDDLNQRVSKTKEVWLTSIEPVVEERTLISGELSEVGGGAPGAGGATNLGVRAKIPAPSEDEMKKAKGSGRKAQVTADKIKIRGLYRSPAPPVVVTETLMASLKESKYFKLEGEVSEYVKDIDDGSDDTLWAWPFTLELPLAEPIVLKTVAPTSTVR